MVRITRTVFNILRHAPEYFFLLLVMVRSPFFPFMPLFLIFGALYVFYIYRRLHEKSIHPLISILVWMYYAALFYLVYFLLKIDLFLSPVLMALVVAAIAYFERRKNLSLKVGFIVFFAATAIALTFARGTEHHNSSAYRKELEHEKYARLLITSDPALPSAAMLNRVIKTLNVSVRNIYIDENEKYLYFTTVPPNQNYNTVYPALFKVSLEHPSQVKFIRYYYCNNFVYDKKRKQFYLPVRMKPEILVVDPETFTIKKHISVPSRYNALDFFLDEKNDRLIAVPEGGRLWLYDLKDNTYTETNRSLYYYSAGFFNSLESKLYTISYLGPYLLKEYDTETFQCKRKIIGGLEPAWSLTYDPARKLFYVAGFFSGKIHVVTNGDFQRAQILPSKPGVRPVVVDSERNVIYAGNYMDDTMSVLNYDGNVLGKIFVGKRCRSLVLSPHTRRLFAGTSIGVLEIDINSFLKQWKQSLERQKHEQTK